MEKIAIIGGGAAGMMAGIAAAYNGNQVEIFEKIAEANNINEIKIYSKAGIYKFLALFILQYFREV